jgi:gluconokinase
MKIPGLRSPYETVGGLYHFARMLDKIRLHADGKLPADYIPNLGTGFDGRVCQFLGIDYAKLVERVKQGGADDEILAWCFANGRKPAASEFDVINGYMSKLGWRDSLSARLAQRLQEAGLSHRTDIQTFFDFIDADEDREVRPH